MQSGMFCIICPSSVFVMGSLCSMCFDSIFVIPCKVLVTRNMAEGSGWLSTLCMDGRVRWLKGMFYH